MGEGKIKHDISESEQEKSSIHSASGSSPKRFDLGIERFGRGVGASVVKEIQDGFIMLLNRPCCGFKSIDTSGLHIIIPDRQPFKGDLLTFTDREYITQPNRQVIGFE